MTTSPKTLCHCDISASIEFCSGDLFLHRIPCVNHGLNCPTADNASYTLSVVNMDTGSKCFFELPVCLTRNLSEKLFLLDSSSHVKATLFRSMQIVDCCGSTTSGFQVASTMSRYTESCLPLSDTSAEFEDEIAEFKFQLNCLKDPVTTSVSRSTYRKATVKWSCSLQVRPHKWMITLFRLNEAELGTVKKEAVAYFYVNGIRNELDLPLELISGATYRVCVSALVMHDSKEFYLTVAEDTVEFRAGM